MKHDDAVLLLPVLLQGHLDPEAEVELREHMESCEKCRALAETYDVMSMVFRTEETPVEKHPSPESVVAYALDTGELQENEKAIVAAHTERCPDCAREAETARQVEADVAPRVTTFPVGRFRRLRVTNPSVAAALAASLVLAALAYPAFMGVLELPVVREELEELRQAKLRAEEEVQALISSLEQSREKLRAVTTWTGPVPLPLLRSGRRGVRPAEIRIAVPEGQPFVSLAVEPVLPEDAAGARVFRFEIRRSDEQVVWTQDLTASEIREYQKSSGVVTFLMPADDLPAGHYVVTLTPLGASPERTLLERPFEIAPAGK